MRYCNSCKQDISDDEVDLMKEEDHPDECPYCGSTDTFYKRKLRPKKEQKEEGQVNSTELTYTRGWAHDFYKGQELEINGITFKVMKIGQLKGQLILKIDNKHIVHTIYRK